jgi:hypothetical protein
VSRFRLIYFNFPFFGPIDLIDLGGVAVVLKQFLDVHGWIILLCRLQKCQLFFQLSWEYLMHIVGGIMGPKYYPEVLLT